MEEFNKRCGIFEDVCDEISILRHKITQNKASDDTAKHMDTIYRIAKDAAPAFYDEEAKTFDSLYNTITEEVKFTETWLNPYSFIIDTKPIFDYKQKITYPSTSNDEEILTYIVHEAWKRYCDKNVYGKNKTLDLESFVDKCSTLSEIVMQICEEHGVMCYKYCINPGFLDTARLCGGYKWHDICFVKLSKGYYLVDLSYRQFFTLLGSSLERIDVPLLNGAFCGIFMTMQKERRGIADTLIQKGYIPLEGDNLKLYLDGFALSFRNGIYYANTGDYSYTTNFTNNNYADFITGKDNQVKHDGYECIGRQRTLFLK